MNPLWRDYSRYQGQVDFDIAQTMGVCGMATRAGISWGYQDAWFPRNWEEAGRVGIYRTSYHVLYPSESVVRQADNWYKVHPKLDIIPRVIDLEVDNGQSAQRIAAATWEMSETVLERDGVRPIIYSRYLLVNNFLAGWTSEMLNKHYWWLAQYLFDHTREHPGPPTLPERDKKPGFYGEAESAAVDCDRWQLHEGAWDMHAWIADTWGEKPPGPPDEEIEPKWVITYSITDKMLLEFTARMTYA